MSSLTGKSLNPVMNRRSVIASAAGLGAMSILAGCSSNGGDSGSASSDAAFKIGTIGPLTGANASYGKSVTQGVELGCKDFSTKELPLASKAEDDQADGEKAVNAFNTLLDWGMQALVGPTTTGASVAVAAECGKAVSKETKIDILVTPAVTILVGVALAKWIAPPIGTAASAFGIIIDNATKLQPFWMGIAVSVLVGVALTLPISSAAICSVLGLTGLAGGAAVAGCCAQMVGFAVMSFRENRWGGLVSQGLGTSMLQMPNIVRNPRIWIAPTLASAITGPIATCVFRLEMNGAPINSGMGTCGLCGMIGVWTGWVSPSEEAAAKGAAAISPTSFDWLGLVLVAIVLPAILAPAFNAVCRRLGWVKDGDLRLR